MKTIRLGKIPVHLIGSVHSTIVDLNQLDHLRPSHIFIEATRDVLGLIRRNPDHSPMLRDLPSVIEFGDNRKIPIFAIDASILSITSRVFSGMSSFTKWSMWKYVLMRKMALPVASVLFGRIIHYNSFRILDEFVTRWAVPASILEEARSLVRLGKSWEDVCELVSHVNEREVCTFKHNPTFDPSAYIELCLSTAIDERLQSVLIDYRNEYMSHQIQRIVRAIPEGSVCAVIVGKNHLEGIAQALMKEEFFPLVEPPVSPPFIDQLLLSQLIRH